MRSPLEAIPGVGPRIARSMADIGIREVADLKGRDPEELFRLDCAKKGFQEDRCALYVWRLAVYFAEHEAREPEKLKWWYWKDHPYPEQD
ncbi:MAG: helix-hairpin-helix domain-containing protein [Oscillospiraceae bacterium]|nr:helix-hairpin-helix domain-containing protein [Oscillospiraceae bacterium]